MPWQSSEQGETIRLFKAAQARWPKILLHVGVVRPSATFRYGPDNVLGWILDVAGFAVNAVLCIDHELRVRTLIIPDHFVHPGRTITLCGFVIERQIPFDRNQIGRASCRERVKRSVGTSSVREKRDQ